MRMMQRMLAIAFMCVAAAAAVLLARAKDTSREADRAAARYEAVREQIASAERLAKMTPRWAQRGRPEMSPGGLAAAVNDVLAAAGVPASSLASLSPAAELQASVGVSAGPGQVGLAARRGRAVLTLSPVTLPQSGAVLRAWAEAQPEWTVSSIELTPEPQGRRELPPGSDLPLRAVLVLEVLYVEAALPAGSGETR